MSELKRRSKVSKNRVTILQFLLSHEWASVPDMAEFCGYKRTNTANIDGQVKNLLKSGLIEEVNRTELARDAFGHRRPRRYYRVPRRLEAVQGIYANMDYACLQDDIQKLDWVLEKILDDRLFIRQGNQRDKIRQMLRLSPEFFSQCLDDPRIPHRILQHRILFLEYSAITSSQFGSFLNEKNLHDYSDLPIYWYLPFFGVCILVDEKNGETITASGEFYERNKRSEPEIPASAFTETMEIISHLMDGIIFKVKSKDDIISIISNVITVRDLCLKFHELMKQFETEPRAGVVAESIEVYKSILEFAGIYEGVRKQTIDQLIQGDCEMQDKMWRRFRGNKSVL